MRILVFLFALFLAVPAFAQDKAANIGTLSDVERLHLEKAALLQRIEELVKEVAQWRQLFAQTSQRLGEFEVAVQKEQSADYLKGTVSLIDAARPGYSFDPKAGAFIPKPQPSAEKKQ